MNRKLITISAAAAVMAFGVTAASADTTVIGSTGQSNQQGVNSSQSGENGSGGGSTYILGNSTPTTTQTSINALVNVQDIGAAGSGSTATLIAPGNDCFCQSSQQGVNSSQVAVNGDGGGTMTAILGDSAPSLTQTSVNVGVNVELIGAVGGDTTLIGGSAQTNDQAFNSAQSGENTSGSTGTLVVGGDSAAVLDQTSVNALINVALLGG